MEVNERIETLEGELKLLKGEMKETLTSVRDYLQTVNISPTSDDSASLSVKGIGVEVHPVEVPAPEKAPEKDSSEEKPQPAPEPPAISAPQQVEGGNSFPETEGKMEPPKEVLSRNTEAKHKPAADSTEKEEKPKSPSQVNMLANLIRWVSAAKNQIGIQQLPILLDVYGMTGNMTAELKQTILHLAEVIVEPAGGKDATSLWGQMMKEQMSRFLDVYGISGQLAPELKTSILHLVEAIAQRPPETNSADTWSRLILELNSILAMDSSLDSLKPFGYLSKKKEAEDSHEEEGEEEQDDDQPIKLRFAVPLRGGEEREFSINLTPDMGSNRKPSAAKQK